MLVLSIETSTSHSSVCLASQEGVVAAASLGRPQRHSEFLTPAIRFCLDHAGADVDAVTGVAVGVGPGLYTGLRVGIATARSFAAARGLPTVGLSGLDALAFQVRHVQRMICTAIDARRGEIFWAFYRSVPGGVQLTTDVRVGTPEKLAAEIDASGRECLVVGDGGIRYRDVVATRDAQVGSMETAWPQATQLAELAMPRFVREQTQRPAELRPLYLRVADARIGWEQVGRRRGGRTDGGS